MKARLVLCLVVIFAAQAGLAQNVVETPTKNEPVKPAPAPAAKPDTKAATSDKSKKGSVAEPGFVDNIRRRKFPIREQDKITDLIAQRIVFDTFRRKARKTKDCIDTMGAAERIALKELPYKLYREAKEAKQADAEVKNASYASLRFELPTFRFTWYKWKRRNLTRYNELVTINREISCKTTRTVSRAAVAAYDAFASTGTGISPVEVMDAAYRRLLRVTAPVDGKLCNGQANKLVPYVARRKRLNIAVWKAWLKSYPEKFKKADVTAFDLNCKPKSAALNEPSAAGATGGP